MRRESLKPRDNWQTRLEEAGCFFHTIEGVPYWQEEAAYVFSADEIDRIEDAAQELHGMCLEHVAEVVAAGDYEGYGFPDEAKALIEKSWRPPTGSVFGGHIFEPHLFGRFDLGYDGKALKMFEYNADTPTSLPEASVWQYHVLEDRGWPDQFNSIHEELLARWKRVWEAVMNVPPLRVHFTASAEGRHEDFGNLHYMLATATEAGVTGATSIDVERLGWREGGDYFLDERERNIELCFKLYPWEWLLAEEIGWKVRAAKTRWVEPAWKLLLSTKALLPLLWQRYPKHPLLLEAHFDQGQTTDRRWLRKPLLGREGANISVTASGGSTNRAVPPELEQYDKHGYVLQEYFKVPPCGKHVPVLGAWVVGDKACGLGIREETGPITTNQSMFVPHYFEE